VTEAAPLADRRT